jgi:predicted metalloprotease
MLWRGRDESSNVLDQRSLAGPALAVGGLGSLVVMFVALVLGVDPRDLLDQDGDADNGRPAAAAAGDEDLVKFVKVVLKDTEDVWDDQFRKMGKTYRKPKLVLFSGHVHSACGLASDAVGPFYCPGDQHVYLDLSFFRELKTKFHAPGEFAQAYVIAHEIGHHVQKQLGYAKKGSHPDGALNDSVRLELQADYLAGVWAHQAQASKHILEKGDIEAALNAANAIGDDTLQRKSRGYVTPDSFTHGTSKQRVNAFRRGFETGDASKKELDRFFTARDL